MRVPVLTRPHRHANARVLVIGHDLFVAILAWLLARHSAQLLFTTGWPGPAALLLEGVLLVALQAFIYWRIGLYRGVWRFASLPDLGNLVRSSLLGSVAAGTVLLIFEQGVHVIAPMLWLYPTILLLSLGLPRLAFRTFKDMRTEVRWRRASQRTLIIGAGRSGRLLLPELRRRGGFDLVGFLDDDPRLRGNEIDGVPVLGGIDRLPRTVREAAIDLAVIAIPSATNAEMQRVVALCEQSGIEFKTLPTLKELGASITRFEDLKPVAIDDLLGRDPVSLDWRAIRAGLAGKRVLVTGGGGSIGAELCRQIARLDPASLVVLDNSEYNLYRIDYQLRNEFRDLVLDSVLGDICDPVTLETVLGRHRPEVVFVAESGSRGGTQQRDRNPSGGRCGRSERRHDLRPDFHRQGRQSLQCHGRDQAHRGTLLPTRGPELADPLHHGPIRQRAQFHRLGGAAVQRADPQGRAGDRDPS
jgi:FlaA1/EpsC-like NDP-sugar epimerase